MATDGINDNFSEAIIISRLSHGMPKDMFTQWRASQFVLLT
jgi:hypothetical protein